MRDNFEFSDTQTKPPTAKELANALDEMCNNQEAAGLFYKVGFHHYAELGYDGYWKLMREVARLETKGKGKDIEVVPSKRFPGQYELDFTDNCPLSK